MKKLFSRDKPKDQPLQPPQQQTPQTTPIHQQFATRPQRSSQDEERWEILEQHTPPLPPGASPPVPSPTVRSPSPYSVTSAKPPAQQTLRKKTPPVLGILHSLDPVQGQGHVRNKSEERAVEVPREMPSKDSKKGGGFWGRSDKDRERERAEMEREREAREREMHRDQLLLQQQMQMRGRERRDEENELTRKIGFLTATASEDWTLVLDVCDHASANEANAKEAVRALRREFKYGEPAAQLAAARLWAIMLRNSSDTFISQSTSRKFLDTLEDLLTNSRTSPVVRERVMDVLAAAAYASGSKKDTGFRGLWRRVKPRDKPEEGMPFDTEDAMFNPPLMSGRTSTYDYDTNTVSAPIVTYQDATPIVPDTPPVSRPPHRSKGKTSDKNDIVNGRDRDIVPGEPPQKHRSDRSGRGPRRPITVIPPEEDMRRLFTECQVGLGNARLLSEALAMATPEQLTDSVIVEFHKKCTDSQELIYTQISWATAGAERSRREVLAKEQEAQMQAQRTRKISSNTLNSINPNGNGSMADLGEPVLTREEELLADLLASNEQLLEALKLYDDLKRVAEERAAEEISRNDTRMNPAQRALLENPNMGGGSSSRSRSPSPSPARVPVHVPPVPPIPVLQQHPSHDYQHSQVQSSPHAQQQQQQTLAPPPPAPHGPRLPGAVGVSRTPSPAHLDAAAELTNGMRVGAGASAGAGAYGGHGYVASSGRASIDDYRDGDGMHEREVGKEREAYPSDEDEPYQPSAKALGKRRVVVEEWERGGPLDDDLSLGPKDHFDDRPLDDEDDEDSPERNNPLAHYLHPVTHFVYDAAAERTQQRIREGHVSVLIVNGVH